MAAIVTSAGWVDDTGEVSVLRPASDFRRVFDGAKRRGLENVSAESTSSGATFFAPSGSKGEGREVIPRADGTFPPILGVLRMTRSNSAVPGFMIPAAMFALLRRITGAVCPDELVTFEARREAPIIVRVASGSVSLTLAVLADAIV